jgi:NTE family protein
LPALLLTFASHERPVVSRFKTSIAVFAVFISAWFTPVASAAEEVLPCRVRPVVPEDRPRIGLALGGGGARGIAHISVMRALEQMKIPVDCIAGTSMGALAGALYASGMSPDEMEKLVLGQDWAQLFNDQLARPERSLRRKRDDELVVGTPGVGISSKGIRIATGVMSGERVMLAFAKFIEPVNTVEHFDDLPIPYRAVAADLNTGLPVVIDDGDLALAMRASMSVPGVWPPVVRGDKVLVDGGVARNVPVEEVRAMGADIVIAVDVGTPLATLEADASVLSVVVQLSGFLTDRNTQASLASLSGKDVMIRPPLGNRVTSAGFDQGPLALQLGQEGVEAVRPQLARLGVPDNAYAQHLSLRTGRQTESPVVEFVRLQNQSRYSDAFLMQFIDVPIGQPLDAEALQQQLYVLFGFNTLSRSTYEVTKEDGKVGVILHVQEKAQGPNYVELGLSTSSDFEGNFEFNVRVGVLTSPVNDSGGETRGLVQLGDETSLLGEYYQPFGDRSRYSFAVRGQYYDRKINQFDDDGNKLNVIGAAQIGLQGVLGREFGNVGAVVVGLRRFTGNAEVISGDPTIPDFDFDIGESFVEASVDRLDSFFFPRQGYIARLRYLYSRESLGADIDFEQLEFNGLYAHAFGNHSFQAGARYNATVAGVAPPQSQYRAGGFTRLVGYTSNELVGQNFVMLTGGYTYKVGELFGQPALIGSSLEYGNVWDERSDIDFGDAILNGSAYFGIDSWIGPILLGTGVREGGAYTLFLEIGHRF